MSVYCDYNAGAPIRPEAAEAVVRALARGGNPSSVHGMGRAARALLEAAREEIGAALSARPADIVLTSGATEALHLAVEGARASSPDLVLIRSAIEHDALAELPCDALFNVDSRGVANLDHLQSVLREAKGRPLVALMAANNETGVIQPVSEAARLTHEAGGLFLCDAAQALGRLPSSDLSFGADYLVVSSHKIGGPPGAGALVVSCDAPFTAPRRGGGQERGRRPGTENVAAIAGFGAAIPIASRVQETESARLAVLRDRFEKSLRAALPGVELIGTDAPRLPNTTVFALPGLKAETAVIAFDLAGVCISAGAACSSGKVRRSRVLEAMGVDASTADCAVRASFGWATTEADIDALIEAARRIGAKSRMPELTS